MGRDEWLPFAFNTDGLALYYDWLTVVLAWGGTDFRSDQGVVTDMALTDDATVGGTAFFCDLMASARANLDEVAQVAGKDWEKSVLLIFSNCSVKR